MTDSGEWVNAKPHFLFPVRALSKMFRGKFLEGLEVSLERGELHLPAGLSQAALFAELTRQA